MLGSIVGVEELIRCSIYDYAGDSQQVGAIDINRPEQRVAVSRPPQDGALESALP